MIHGCGLQVLQDTIHLHLQGAARGGTGGMRPLPDLWRWARKKVRRKADRALAKLRTRRKVWKRLQVSAKDFAEERKSCA